LLELSGVLRELSIINKNVMHLCVGLLVSKYHKFMLGLNYF
jgi:hypothetical protein